MFSLPISAHNEVSIKGTYAVHEDIFLEFLALNSGRKVEGQGATKAAAEDAAGGEEAATNQRSDFEERLWIVVGDQMTVERIRSVKAESVESTAAFDKRDWMLPVPAWFHTFINGCYTVLRTHWSSNSDGQHLDYSLFGDATF